MPTSPSWLKEWLTPHEAHLHQLKSIVVQARTQFQKAIVADSYSFGRCLILDGEMQSAEYDEFIYHETLVHPALLVHPAPHRVLILGGGEGATAREILKHKSVQKIVMVDIDGEVLAFCKRYLPSWHRGSFEDPRLQVIIDDAKTYIETTDEKFDIIISDLPTPNNAGGPASLLYTLEFYRKLIKRLNKGGVFVMQASSGHSLQFELHQVLFATLKRIFRIVRPYYSYVPSFDVPWAFLIGSNIHDPLLLSVRQTDGLIRKRVKGRLDFYDGVTHSGLFHIPKSLRTALSKEKRTFTKSHPLSLTF